MNQQGQGESQPGEGASALDDLAKALEGAPENDEPERDADPDASDSDEGEQEVEVEDEPEESEEAEDDPTVKITHDGKEVELKLSEAKELAQKGFDYQTKTMALAEERKALEPIRAKAEEARQHNEQALNAATLHLQAVVEFLQTELGEPPPIEWAHQDAGMYIAHKDQYESRKGKLEKAQHALQATQHEQHRQRQALIAQTISETQATLKNTLPDWDHAKENELAAYVGKAGLTPDKSDMAFWHAGFWQMAHKAKAYDAIQSRKAEMKPVKQLAKVNKPAAANTTGKQAERTKREADFNKDPSVNNLARLLR